MTSEALNGTEAEKQYKSLGTQARERWSLIPVIRLQKFAKKNKYFQF